MKRIKLAVAGVGNNISALWQGLEFYRRIGRGAKALPGVTRPLIGGLGVTDIDIVACFEVDPGKIGLPLEEAIFQTPNNYPRLVDEMRPTGVIVSEGYPSPDPGRSADTELRRVSELLVLSSADIFLYSLPCGHVDVLEFYLGCCLEAGIGFVNCTPDPAALHDGWRERFAARRLPLIGDDLASHLGSSVVHRHLLQLFRERGITIEGSYQLNLGGNTDFRNLLQNNLNKRASKFRALDLRAELEEKVVIVPSAAFVPHLSDHKVGIINVTGIGWCGTEVILDVKLMVQDSSNAAGVIVDLIRVAALLRMEPANDDYLSIARKLLKSPGF